MVSKAEVLFNSSIFNNTCQISVKFSSLFTLKIHTKKLNLAQKKKIGHWKRETDFTFFFPQPLRGIQGHWYTYFWWTDNISSNTLLSIIPSLQYIVQWNSTSYTHCMHWQTHCIFVLTQFGSSFHPVYYSSLEHGAVWFLPQWASIISCQSSIFWALVAIITVWDLNWAMSILLYNRVTFRKVSKTMEDKLCLSNGSIY